MKSYQLTTVIVTEMCAKPSSRSLTMLHSPIVSYSEPDIEMACDCIPCSWRCSVCEYGDL